MVKSLCLLLTLFFLHTVVCAQNCYRLISVSQYYHDTSFHITDSITYKYSFGRGGSHETGWNYDSSLTIHKTGVASWAQTYRTYQSFDNVLNLKLSDYTEQKTSLLSPWYGTVDGHHTYTYYKGPNQQHIAQYLIKNFDPINKVWTDHFRYTYYYNGDDMLDSSSYEVFYITWFTRDKTIFIYDSKGNITNEALYSIDNNGVMLPVGYRENIYNSANKQIVSRFYNYGYGKHSDSIYTTYDALDSPTLKVIRQWNNTSSSLENYQRISTTYNALHLRDTITTQFPGSTPGSWVNINRNIYTYDSTNKISSKSIDVWDSSLSNWANSETWFYYYDTCNALNIPNPILSFFSIYPNPNDGNFTIEINDANYTNVSVVVYDIIGRQVYSKSQIPDSKFQIALTDAPKGIYIVKIQLDDAVMTKQIVLE